MWKLKACPRCGGDLMIENDFVSGWYAKCLQCSFQHEIKPLTQQAVLANPQKVLIPLIDSEQAETK